MENNEIPSGIGPHEGKEFTLMRSGEKNVALFYEIEPDGLIGMLEDRYNLLQFLAFKHKGVSYFTWIVFRDGFANDALRLKELIEMKHVGINSEHEHEIGKILSYKPEDVEVFLKHSQKLRATNAHTDLVVSQ
ncbi:MAG: hypothetical protein ACPGVN_02235 [Alphaproteobacteria bacterium]